MPDHAKNAAKSMILSKDLAFNASFVPSVIEAFDLASELTEEDIKILVNTLYETSNTEMAVKCAFMFKAEEILPCDSVLDELISKTQFGLAHK